MRNAYCAFTETYTKNWDTGLAISDKFGDAFSILFFHFKLNCSILRGVFKFYKLKNRAWVGMHGGN